jgi:hypothetical protein
MNEKHAWHPTWQEVDNVSWSIKCCVRPMTKEVGLMQSQWPWQ